MKKYIWLFVLMSFNSFAVDWGKKIPGSNYTLKDLYFQQNLLRNNMKQQQQLNGTGVEFSGPVEISPSDKDPKEKIYKVYIRNCGKVELTKKSPEEMDAIKPGMMIKLRFISARSCSVSDWSRL